MAIVGKRNPSYKHGFAGTRVYRIWKGMIKRCYSVTSASFAAYGARGISVCEEWRTDGGAFCKWSMANGYADNLTIDRIDGTKGYEPSNCRWITLEDQQSNRSSNTYVTAFGETKIILEWSRDDRCVVNYECLVVRLRRGVAPEEAITRPDSLLREAFGERKTLPEWVRDRRCKISFYTLKSRLHKGWNLEEALSTPRLKPGKTSTRPYEPQHALQKRRKLQCDT